MMRAFSILLKPAIVVGITAMIGCSAGYVVQQDEGPRGYLRLEVEPAHVEVEVDEKYSGVANGWVDSTIPIAPGVRRVTLSADGYITQRFDLEIAPYEHVTLQLRLEPMLELPEPEREPNPLKPRRPKLRASR